MEIEIRNLTKHYGSVCALDDFSVTLGPGIYGILGPNGAGKSTLMNLLTDTLKRETGQILLDGKDILSLGRDYRAVLGYMPQQQGYYEEFSVGRFLFYMAALKGMGRKETEARIRQLLDTVGLSDCRHKKMGSLSGGMRQRVLLVQALLNQPEVLLLDEPTAGLDPEERIRIRNYISAISADRVILLATHVVSDIESIAERILILRKGKLIAVDTPANLIHRVRPHVSEITCLPEELESWRARYSVSSITQLNDRFLLRLVGEDLPPSQTDTPQVTLDDVYLYYMHCV